MNTISIRSLKMLFLLILLVAIPMTAFAKDKQDKKVRVYVEYSVGHKGAVKGALAKAGAKFHYEFDELNSFAITLPEAALKGIIHNPNVVSIEEDAPRYLEGPAVRSSAAPEGKPSSKGQITPYGVSLVQAPDVWKKGFDGYGCKVCVIDSGYSAVHEDLPDDVEGTSQIEGELFTDDGNSHGSHVSGTIVAMDNKTGVVGVAPGADLFMVKIFDFDGLWVAHSSDLVKAAYTCEENGANIISMSLSGTKSNGKEKKAFQTLYDRGILSIAAASNDGIEEYHYPASYPSVVSVAAIDESYVVADFSQHNDAVELAAPGVGVLSTTSYIATDELVVDNVTYSANGIEYSPYGTASGDLVDGGLCDATGNWTEMVVLCERGSISFYDKVMNVQNSGGAAAVIYNNEPGNFFGTLGDGNTSDIPAISISQEDGQYLVDNKLGEVGDVTHLLTYPASGYEAWDGTSMATPHVSAVAALIWSANSDWTNEDIRNAMQETAMDLGDDGRDPFYGFGAVQADSALEYLLNGD